MSAQTPMTAGVDCIGATYGTITTAKANLSVTATADGLMTGTFTNNGTVFRAAGRTNTHAENGRLTFSQINLDLDSRVSGGANASAGVQSGNASYGVSGGLSTARGSTGTLTGVVDSAGGFTGTFRGVQGSYRAVLQCNQSS